MNPIILTISLLFLFGIETEPKPTSKPICKIFKAWNLATLQSIKDQLKQTTDPKSKSQWENELDVRSFTLYSPTGDKNNVPDKGKPSRYKFLQAIDANKGFHTSTFIIESYSSGEVVVFRDYIIQNSLNSSHVIAYTYYKNEWVKVKDTLVSKIDLESELIKDNMVNNNFKGNNITDVILSEIGPTGIKSHYYISLSLETNNVVQEILEM